MSPIIKRVTVGRDHHIRIEIDLPADFPEGDAEAVVDLKPVVTTNNRLSEICGKGKGRFWMSDDFDEPLDDFAD